MTLVEMYKAIKKVAEDSGLVSKVYLVKSDKNIGEIADADNYRKVLIAPQDAEMYSDNDSFTYHIVVIDKTTHDDETMLASINDTMSLIRTIVKQITTAYNNRVEVQNININSGDVDGQILTSVDFDLIFEYTTVLL